ncbi:helix-turn-helix transcriptional regulator [Segeticoccus rhizosphaerae]|uniref:helix-turn-helix transcriptional regulator n=1 Tax=Segeticoccus rhizosphaerae TaxID=1104777 RepID=UPI0010C0183D|nr:WYL domain-containing protein [Ornithinicoccus soli]
MSQTAVRLLSLLSLLQSPRAWSGGELAKRFGVSARTVRHDIERLRELGYAVEGTRGGEGGYRLGSGGASLPPLLLDPDEAIAVAVGLRTGVNCIIGGMEETSVRALAKLEQTLPSRLRIRVHNLGRYTVPLPSNHPMPMVDPTLLTVLVGLCDSRERLRFRYPEDRVGADEQGAGTTYDVEPYRLVNRQHRWYLLAFAVDEGDWRVFRVDRIDPRLPTGPRFSPRELPTEDVAAYVAQHLPGHVWRHRATVRLRAPARDLEGKITSAEGAVEPIDDRSCVLHLGAESLQTMALALARLDVEFTVVDSPELLEVVRTFADRFNAAVARGSA